MRVRFTGHGSAYIRYRDAYVASGETINLKKRIAEHLIERSDFELP